MMKKNLFTICILFCLSACYGQSMAINTDGSTADTSALLDVKSTTKGMLIPRMSKAQRNAITTPANGLIVYVNAPDTIGLCFYDGFVWKWMEEKGNGWSLTGNAGTNPANNYVGTNDMTDLAFRIGGFSEYMRLTKEAELGISESDPKYTLDVRTGFAAINNCLNNGIRIKRNFANNDCETGMLLGFSTVFNEANNALIWNYGQTAAQPQNLLFGLGNTETMRLTNNRELGISEQAPKYTLDIKTGTTAVNPCLRNGLRINTSGTSGSDCDKGFFLGYDSTAAFQKISFWNFTPNATSTNQFIRFGFGPDFSQLPSGFGEAMRILPPGQGIGIGTVAPLSVLHLMNNTGSGLPTGLMVSKPALAGPEFRGFYSGLASSNNPSGNDGAIWNYQHASINFGTNNTDRMRITDNGFIGINTINPYAGLHVNGHNVFFTNSGNIPASPPILDVNGAGRRLLWYADQAAFRAGYVSGNQWDFGQIGNYSFAGGNSTKASGSSATAFGLNTTASGNQSASMGAQTNATGNYSFATGLQTTASGISSVAAGENTIASGLASVALGYQANAPAQFSVAMGYQTVASGNNAVAMGNQSIAAANYSFASGDVVSASGIASVATGSHNIASGNFSLATGNNCVASGLNAIAAGNTSWAYGDHSVALGNMVKAYAFGGFAVGSFNDDTDSPNGTDPALTDRVFQIGNGTPSLRGNALTVLRNGNVGIGNTNPSIAGLVADTKVGATHAVFGSNTIGVAIESNYPGIGFNTYYNGGRFAIANGYGGYMGVDPVSGGMQLAVTTASILAGNSAPVTAALFISSAANIGIGTTAPTQKLHVIGNILATGTITPSDRRYKKNIQPLEDALAKIQQLNGVTYQMSNRAFTEWNFEDTRQYGLIAQDVEKVFPEMVKQVNAEGYKGIDYVKLVPVLIEAIKELKKDNDLQQAQIDQLIRTAGILK